MFELKKGDIVTYENETVNYVNRPDKYRKCFRFSLDVIRNRYNGQTITKVQRYKKFLCFYRLVTIYESSKWI